MPHFVALSQTVYSRNWRCSKQCGL